MTQAPASAPRREPSAYRRRGRLTRPAASLIAQGEPMVWLSGGAMATCLAMIVSLLALVFWNGLPTFWPAPVIRLERVDGQVLVGEVAREETFRVDPDTVGELPAAEAAAARDWLQKHPQGRARRRLIRIGNFELTNEHYRWVTDFAVRADGEQYPEWSIVVERLEWGRFYGEPIRFTRRLPRELSADEQQLASIQTYLESQRWRLTDAQVESFNAAIAPVNAALEAVRGKSLQSFLTPFASGSGTAGNGTTHELLGEDGQALAAAGGDAGGPLPAAARLTWTGAAAAWGEFERSHDAARQRHRTRYQLEQHDLGLVNARMEEARLAVREQEILHRVAAVDLAGAWKQARAAVLAIDDDWKKTQGTLAALRSRFGDQPALTNLVAQFETAQSGEIAEARREPQAEVDRLETSVRKLPQPVQEAVENYVAIHLAADLETAVLQQQIATLNEQNAREELVFTTASGQEKGLQLADIVRAYPANQLHWLGKGAVYWSRWQEFLWDEPREANSEGGVFPALWGTIVMTLVMSMLVVPFGVLAALYLREYAQAGWIVSAVRISISNLAGVPSIVFGVFGLGFFCYVLGSYVDGGPQNAGLVPLPPRGWWVLLIGTSIGAFVAFAAGLASTAAGRTSTGRGRRRLSWLALILWLACAAAAGVLLFRSPFFGGLFASALPNPTFGKGGLLWASLTLSLLTLPVVIVATEEALSAVPNSLREGSFACGASKWQTIRRIVLPHAMPGIMTGMILAIARGAGEAAPLMLVGAVKLAPDLPIDGSFPFVHLDRSFMHLGFLIYDVGFQSQNSEAAKPMVFTTTLLLILVIATLNLFAIWLRSRLRRRYLGSQF